MATFLPASSARSASLARSASGAAIKTQSTSLRPSRSPTCERTLGLRDRRTSGLGMLIARDNNVQIISEAEPLQVIRAARPESDKPDPHR